MQTETDIRDQIVRFQEACSSGCSNPGLKWNLLKSLSLCFLNQSNSKFQYVTEYCTILTTLLDVLSPTLFRNKSDEHLFTEYFINGLHPHSFIILTQRLSSSCPSFQQMKIIELFEHFIRKGNIYFVLHGECCNIDVEVLRSSQRHDLWENLITYLVSLPDRVSNKAKQPVRKLFCPSSYVPFLISNVWKVLYSVHENLISEKDCGIEFLGKLVGRLCSVGHSSTVAKILCSNFVQACESDYIWRRITQNLIVKIPTSNLESFLTQALQEIPWFGYVDWILGDSVLTNKKIEYLMTVKFILMRQFKNDLILQNIIGYFAQSDARKGLFDKVFTTLLDVWSDESAFRHQSFAQQYYLAAAIMCCIAHIKVKNVTITKDLMQPTVEGVQIRIGNSDNLVRNVGMIVGETLISVLQPEISKPEFDYGIESLEIKHLQDLTCVPEKPEKASQEENLLEFEKLYSDREQGKNEDKQSADHPSSSKENEDLDSDDEDDVEPYDLPNEEENEMKNRPHYIRDCLQGLLEAEKPEWTEQCLRYAPDLIRSHPDDTAEVAKELAKVLLHLDDTFGMSDFIPCRHRALITLTVHCPLEVGLYLTTQFYERDYNIRQRLDILEVIAAASQALSQPDFQKSTDCSPALPPKKEEGWQKVIEKRLESKTRLISRGPRRKMPEPQLNLFGPVASSFFFPLIEKFDRGNKMLNLLGEDSYVLGRLLYTLGIVMHSSANLPICRSMGSSLLKFINAVCNHCDAFVRRGAVFAATMVFMSVPSFLLLSELQEEVLTCQNWLSEVIDNDSEVECQVRAAQAMQLLVKNVEDELPSLNVALSREIKEI